MEKKLYDSRGRQANIARLAGFDREGFVHMLFYRCLVFYSIAYGILLLAFITYGWQPVSITLLTAVEWILFTPQAFETVKGFSLISSRGLSFGHLSEEYTSLIKKKYNRNTTIYGIVPYFAMLLWAAGFVAMLLWLSV